MRHEENKRIAFNLILISKMKQGFKLKTMYLAKKEISVILKKTKKNKKKINNYKMM